MIKFEPKTLQLGNTDKISHARKNKFRIRNQRLKINKGGLATDKVYFRC